MSVGPARCKSCGAAIMWLTNARTGKAAPIDVVPNNAGNCIWLDETHYLVMSKADEQANYDEPKYTSHFQTCPQAGAWRRA